MIKIGDKIRAYHFEDSPDSFIEGEVLSFSGYQYVIKTSLDIVGGKKRDIILGKNHKYWVPQLGTLRGEWPGRVKKIIKV